MGATPHRLACFPVLSSLASHTGKVGWGIPLLFRMYGSALPRALPFSSLSCGAWFDPCTHDVHAQQGERQPCCISTHTGKGSRYPVSSR